MDSARFVTMNSQKKASLWREALEIFSEAPTMKTVSHNAAISCFRDVLKWREAMKIFNEMSMKRVSPT